jgi:long-subunit fatty acid transport protein
MYHSRHQRTSIYLNFAHKQTEEFAWSLGAILGFQASADVTTNLDLNGGTTGSWAQAKTKIDPSLGAIVSTSYKFEKSTVYFTFQQEMKSNLDAHVNGDVVNPSLGLFDANIRSLIFYDPYTFRIGSNYTFDSLELFGGLEYQMWNSYRPPVISVIKNGGTVTGSKSYETIKTRDTINPRVGAKYNFTNRISGGLGFCYRMSPLDSDFSGNGNSIDVDSYIFTGGLSYRLVVWSKDVTLGTSLEYHKLKDHKVTKTTNQEDGSAGVKIGAPGYNIGGHILSAAAGVKFNF